MVERYRRSAGRIFGVSAALLVMALCLAFHVQASVITISNNSDTVNGDVSSPENLTSSPGADGISLQEALLAANNAAGPHTLRFAGSLKGSTITLQGWLPEITRNGIDIRGDIDGDGVPDITIDGGGSSGCPFRIKTSSVSISFLIMSNFTSSGVQVLTDNNGPNLVENITIKGNRISAGWDGIHVANQGSDRTIRNVLITGNSLVDNGFSGIFIGAGGEQSSSRNSVSNVQITDNSIMNFDSNRLSVVAFGGTLKGGSNNTLTGLNILRNTMNNLLLISGGNAMGCQNNRVEDVVIAGNSIQASPMAIEILGGAQDGSSPSQGEATDVSGNVVSNVRIAENSLVTGGIQFVGADGQYRAPQYLALQNRVENVLIERNTIRDCPSSSGIQFQGGSHGGQNNTVRWATIRNNLIVRNQNGAGISLLGGFEYSDNNTIRGVDVVNNTIAENGNSWAGGININDNNRSSGNVVTGVSIRNTIFWANQGGDAIRGPIPPETVEHSITGDWRYTGSNGNFYLSPQFVDPGNLNYRLQTESPAVDSGNPSSPWAGEVDFGGETRIYDGNLDGIAVIDIGAYELHRDALSFSPGWNFVSFPKLPADKSAASVLSELLLLQKVKIVWGYDNAAKRWLSFRPQSQEHPSGEDNLGLMSYMRGYWIYLEQPGVVQFAGWESPASSEVILFPGWNLAGYVGQGGRSVSEALGNSSAPWSFAWTWENGEWKASYPDDTVALPLPLFTVFSKERAYWIKIRPGQTTVWTQ